MKAHVLLAFVTAAIAHMTPIGQTPTRGDRYTDRIPGTSVSFEMTYVGGGSFLFGSPAQEEGRGEDEGPRFQVEVSPFWVGVHEVTADEYAVFRNPLLDSDSTAIPGHTVAVDAVSRPSPPYEDPGHGLDEGRHPAVGMTQLGALRYARWLSEKTGRLYRLPTEAEWEYACRAGSMDPLGSIDPAALPEHAWFAENSDETHQPVGAREPNAWGVHDMLGNVAEWTLDEYRADFYGTLEDGAEDPWAQPTSVHPRTVRGGAFDDQAAQLRCADRLESTLRWKRRDPQIPKSRWWNTDSPHVGFRLVAPAGDWTLESIRAYWADVLPDGD
ncbi:MAG: formylglycine-generating enzyme family protein [Gemmatimonadota bacterium]|nr:formylglycine-generating enzyme family protein [Gemmatimonadota bacterium]